MRRCRSRLPPLLRGLSASLLGGCASLALLAAPSLARADDPVEPIRLRFAAPAGCPDADAFSSAILGRTARARPAAEGEVARTFAVTVRRDRARFRGRLETREPSGATGSREVSGETCDDVVSALALITALAVDPQASVTPRPPPPPPAPVEPPKAILAPAALRLIFPPFSDTSTLAPPLPALPSPPAPAAPRAEPVRVTGGVRVAWIGAIAPTLAQSTAIFVDFERSFAPALTPSLRLSAIRADAGPRRFGLGSASFRWTAGRLDGCPLRLRQGPVSLAPCAGFEAGVLEATGRIGGTTTSPSRPWLAAELFGRLQVAPLDAFTLEAEGGLTLPFYRDTFVFDPTTTLHEVPVAGGFFGFGAAVRFP